uniref:Uncharacterized protein n=1 Tax=Rhizophora mucronata TaxID=61149 RepID=A0A2P2PD16_RHIMU
MKISIYWQIVPSKIVFPRSTMKSEEIFAQVI